MFNKENPIGFFDSGIGGTSIWKEMIHLLPNENTIYLADSANAPYGKRSKEEIIALSKKNTDYLLSKDCKMIVVACNTATTNAISFLREKYTIPFIGIEPAIKPAALSTQTNSIGILATQGTLSSSLFAKTSDKFAKGVNIIEQVGKGLVELIESGSINTPQMNNLLVSYLKPMMENQIDHLILGCTHYPYLIPKIKKIIGQDIKIIDSGFAVSKQIKNILEKNNLLNSQSKKGKYQFYTNTNSQVLASILPDKNLSIEVKQIVF
jgi:glutamate racemase